MACAACEAAQRGGAYLAERRVADGASYFVRVGVGNVEVRGCRDHVAMLIACWRRISPTSSLSIGREGA